ncbi:MAG: CocE/NonD family hydrolase, partial [Gemmatimonadota bacterium]
MTSIAEAQRAPARFDVYMYGIRAAELTVAGPSKAPTYSIRKKDLASNIWSSAHSAPIGTVPADTAFLLWGSIRDFPAQLARLEAVDWQSHDVLGWPDRASIYERTRELKAVVAGKPVNATRWNKRDAFLPMDLIVGPHNDFVAGIDSRADIVVVRRGFEGFTTIAAWNDPKVSQARYGFRSLGKQMMPAADGVGLATLVYLPSAEAKGPFPTVFIRTPYGITGLIDGYWHYVARGFAVVLQAVRGTSFTDPAARSEGELE